MTWYVECPKCGQKTEGPNVRQEYIDNNEPIVNVTYAFGGSVSQVSEIRRPERLEFDCGHTAIGV